MTQRFKKSSRHAGIEFFSRPNQARWRSGLPERFAWVLEETAKRAGDTKQNVRVTRSDAQRLESGTREQNAPKRNNKSAGSEVNSPRSAKTKERNTREKHAASPKPACQIKPINAPNCYKINSCLRNEYAGKWRICFKNLCPRDCLNPGYLTHIRIASHARPNTPACSTPSNATKGTWLNG